jgi:signal transduction histidine kinase
MPQGGRLRCVSRADRRDGTVEVIVSDTGVGISSDAQTHLFEPFFTTRPEGTGLGLAICREIILQHDGKIELVSREKAGATFRVTLPMGGRNS